MPTTTFYNPANQATTTLLSSHTIGDGFLHVVSPSTFPVVPFRVTCIRASDGARAILKISTVVGNAFTVVGATESTSDLNLAAGDSVSIYITAAAISDLNAAVHALEVTGGPIGHQGYQGRQGVVGNQGLLGNQGDQGPQGTQGVQGVQGLLGTQGNQGFQGRQGTQGLQGNQGFQGIGNQGNQGYQSGLSGFQGNQGFQGQGLQGNQGFQSGQQGYQGRQGYQGGGAGSQGLQLTMPLKNADGSPNNNIGVLVSSSFGLDLSSPGLAQTSVTGSGIIQFSTATTTSSTFASLGLTCSINSGESWCVEWNLICTGSTGGLRFQLLGPTSSVFASCSFGNTSSASTMASDSQTALSTPTQAYMTGNTNGIVTVRALLYNAGSAVSLALQYASVTNTQSNSVLAGSYSTIHRI